MAIAKLSAHWRRLGDDPNDAPAHNDGRRAIPAWLQADIDDGVIRSTRSTPGYEGRHREWDGEVGVTGVTPGIGQVRDRRAAESERQYAASLRADEGGGSDA